MSGARLLVVEDEAVIAALLSDFLQQQGFEVTLAGSVGEAVDQLDRAEFDLCLSDFMLPDRTGLDFVQEIRKRSLPLRMLLMTAYLEPELEDRVEAEPTIVGVVRKPMDIVKLLKEIERLLESLQNDPSGEPEVPERQLEEGF